LLRFFDRIRWYPVSAEELRELRADMAAGRLDLKIEEGEFSLAEYRRFLAANADSIERFRARQAAAFTAERAAWEEAGEFARGEQEEPTDPVQEIEPPPGAALVEAEFTASVWQLAVAPGDRVVEGQKLVVLEAMKMESTVVAPAAGVVDRVLAEPGDQVEAGQALVVLRGADGG
jgi:urea carboxylase